MKDAMKSFTHRPLLTLKLFYVSLLVVLIWFICLENSDLQLGQSLTDKNLKPQSIYSQLVEDDLKLLLKDGNLTKLKAFVARLPNTLSELPEWDKRSGHSRTDYPTNTSTTGIPADRPRHYKKILVWHYAYGKASLMFRLGRRGFRDQGCEEYRCTVTDNRSLFPVESYDAIIFHFRGLKPLDMPRKRSPHQRYIFFESESASYVFRNPHDFDKVFNWTMTYRRDSDIVHPYGRVEPHVNLTYTEDLAAGKTKMAAWFVSNCLAISRRQALVRALSKYIKVDVYGKCGNDSCPPALGDKCFQQMASDYKFYLSFENSLCRDYVTEKFFRVLRYDVVPVVFGLANYSALAPPKSFINVFDFNTVKDLANYLKYLDGNETAYSEYFEWKKHYRSITSPRDSFCTLCKKLHEDKSPKTYNNLEKWFVEDSFCKMYRPDDSHRVNKFNIYRYLEFFKG